MPNAPAIDIATLAATFAFITTFVMQYIKLWAQTLFPIINDPKHVDLRDNTLRTITGLLNFVLLLIAAGTLPAVFKDWQWWDILLVALVQSGASTVAYKAISKGSYSEPLPTTPTATFNPLPQTMGGTRATGTAT